MTASNRRRSLLGRPPPLPALLGPAGVDAAVDVEPDPSDAETLSQRAPSPEDFDTAPIELPVSDTGEELDEDPTLTTGGQPAIGLVGDLDDENSDNERVAPRLHEPVAPRLRLGLKTQANPRPPDDLLDVIERLTPGAAFDRASTDDLFALDEPESEEVRRDARFGVPLPTPTPTPIQNRAKDPAPLAKPAEVRPPAVAEPPARVSEGTLLRLAAVLGSGGMLAAVTAFSIAIVAVAVLVAATSPGAVVVAEDVAPVSPVVVVPPPAPAPIEAVPAPVEIPQPAVLPTDPEPEARAPSGPSRKPAAPEPVPVVQPEPPPAPIVAAPAPPEPEPEAPSDVDDKRGGRKKKNKNAP